MRVLINKLPRMKVVKGVSVDGYRPGYVYEVPAAIGNFLVAEGYALVELRHQESASSWSGHDRRRRSRT